MEMVRMLCIMHFATIAEAVVAAAIAAISYYSIAFHSYCIYAIEYRILWWYVCTQTQYIANKSVGESSMPGKK